ncbi:3-oxoacyl-reductase [Hypoxylon sp. NC1633]|nr:3-oxoacyl-reductase [Hypoxylon sp. NC1633]
MATLEGKVFAITGGASGIGLATAQILSSRGGTVCIADVDPAALIKAEEYFTNRGVPFTTTKTDVSKSDEVNSWIDGIMQKYGRLDGAANVAGIIGKQFGISDVAGLEDAEWDRMMAVNLTGMFYCLRAELRNIVDGGSIVNVSSIHGLQGFAKYAAYDTTKHGIIGLTKAAAKEVGHREIRVNAVAPGAIHTPLMEKSWKIHNRGSDAPDDQSAFGRQGTSEECGNVLAFLLGPDSKFVSGSVYSVDGGAI